MQEQGVVPRTLSESFYWIYDKAIEGAYGLTGAQALADEYKNEYPTVEAAIDELIMWQVIQAGSIGFVTGCGGALALPVTIPANVAAVGWLQTRMVAAIAHISGQNVRSQKVRTSVLAVVVGSAVVDQAKAMAGKVGGKVADGVVKGIGRETLTAINKLVGFRLVTKYGTTGVVNLSKAVPVVGGVVNGSFDALTTRHVGGVAKRLFLGPAPHAA